MKREISAQLVPTGSDQHVKHSLTAEFCFCVSYCCYEANCFVSDFPHIDFFDTVQEIILCTIFLTISSKQFGYVVVATLITNIAIFN